MRVEGGVLAEEVKSGRAFHAGGVFCRWQADVLIGAVNVYRMTVDASNHSVNSPNLHHDVTIEGSQLLPSVYKFSPCRAGPCILYECNLSLYQIIDWLGKGAI